MAASIDITDQATPALARVIQAIRQKVAPAIGAAVVRLFQDNFAKLPDNKHNWPSTGFWAQAARATNYDLLADGVQINVNKQGVRQRLQGGEIHAEGDGYLTIPAQARAYGHRAREFSLRMLFSRRGGSLHPWGLISDEVKDGDRTDGVMFWLTKSVTQDPNPDVIPSVFEIAATAIRTVNQIVDRAAARADARPTGGVA